MTEALELRFERGEHALAMGALTRLLLRVVADDMAPTRFALADHDFLDAQVLGALLIASRAAKDRLVDLPAEVDGHAHDVAAPTRAQRLEILLRDHPRIPDEHTATQPPVLEFGLDFRDRGHIHRVARKYPVAHRTDLPPKNWLRSDRKAPAHAGLGGFRPGNGSHVMSGISILLILTNRG